MTVTEGNTGTTSATFTVTLAPASGQTVTVDYATADGTATAPADYAARVARSPSPRARPRARSPSRSRATLLDEVERDLHGQPDEPGQRHDRRRPGLGTITDDDPLPALSINDVTVTEGDAGTIDATFTVSLNAPAATPITVDYATADGTRRRRPTTPPASGTLTFAPGQTSQAGHRPGQGRHCSTRPTRPSSSTCTNPHERDDRRRPGRRHDHRRRPAAGALDQRRDRDRGQRGTVAGDLHRQPRAASGRTVTVDYATADRDGRRRRPTTRRRRGTRHLRPRPDEQPVTVLVNGDLLDEINETFFVNLSNRQRHDRRRPGRRHDHRRRRAPALSINDVTVTEGNAGTVDATFTVSLDAASGQTVTVDYATANGTAQRARRLHGRDRHAHLRPRPDHPDGHGAGQRRHRSTRPTRPSS